MVIHNWGYLDEYRNEREELLAAVAPKTHLIDTDHVTSLIGGRTRCLLPVHLYGRIIITVREPLDAV